ncbi:hypothetical protein DIPPA_08067 [Diplonema papillatum]|nr:hypothetical protein DIPPA_26796 [Diplonema papillatum]KAJ9437192.1 hypothetical protein DIPPA_11981 [Diplonema papillatum]KAJ9437634.1 hypothetical protein DIPPA_33332 [Diplonema papillatum]KAJ9438534.1 hypothetical protein DIPPA_21538 [Diplonema papillatum]KAJ9438968.1 hypothetical protein DIPPA_17962 [Diplonema papillatum]
MRRGVAIIEAATPPPVTRVRVGDEEADVVDLEEREKQRQEELRREKVQRLKGHIERLAAPEHPLRLPDNNIPRGPRYTKAEFVSEFGKKEGEREWRTAVKAHTEARKRQVARLQQQLDELQPTAKAESDVEMQQDAVPTGAETAVAWEAWAQQQKQQRQAWEKERAVARATWEHSYEQRFLKWAEAQTQIAKERYDETYKQQLLWMGDVERRLLAFEDETNARIESMRRIPSEAPPAPAIGNPAPAPVSPPDDEPPRQPLSSQTSSQTSKKGKKQAAKKEAEEQEAELLRQMSEVTKKAGKAKGAKGSGKQQSLVDMMSTGANRYSPIEK